MVRLAVAEAAEAAAKLAPHHGDLKLDRFQRLDYPSPS